MTDERMHADELAIDGELVRSLLTEQLPRWADLPLSRVRSAGTENALFRLGDELVVRLPRHASAEGPIDNEFRWLPRLAPALPLAIPEPLALGEPAAGYPWRWSVYRWIEGEAVDARVTGDPHGFAETLARFVVALQSIDTSDGPPPGDHNGWRGEALGRRDAEFREALAACDGIEGIDVATIASVWDEALGEPGWGGDPVWVHGDLLPTNLLTSQDRLGAVLDFGSLGVGEPTCDVMAAWTTVAPEARPAYRAVLGLDEATWARGRGWALSWAVIALPYYLETNPTFVTLARRTIDAVLTDPDR